MTAFASSHPLSPQPEPQADFHLDTQHNTIRVVSASLTELESVSDLLTESFHRFHRWNQWLSPLLARGICEDLRHRHLHAPPPYLCLLAYLKPPVPAEVTSWPLVGTIEISRPSRSSTYPSYLYLSNLAVRSHFRRQGIGTQLLKACELIAHQHQAMGLYLHVLADNQPARQLYQNCGFSIGSSSIPWRIPLISQRYVFSKLLRA